MVSASDAWRACNQNPLFLAATTFVRPLPVAATKVERPNKPVIRPFADVVTLLARSPPLHGPEPRGLVRYTFAPSSYALRQTSLGADLFGQTAKHGQSLPVAFYAAAGGLRYRPVLLLSDRASCPKQTAACLPSPSPSTRFLTLPKGSTAAY